MSKETAETLRRAKALIDAPEKFTRNADARTASGEEVPATDIRATCFCSVGAIIAAFPGVDGHVRRTAAEAALQRAASARRGGKVTDVVWYSDSLSHAEAMAWWDETIATEEAEPAPAVAAEGRYAVLFGKVFALVDGGGIEVCDHARAVEVIAEREEGELVRILADGAHEAALAAARREERERISALFATEAERLDIGCEESGVYLRAAEIAKKGQAK